MISRPSDGHQSSALDRRPSESQVSLKMPATSNCNNRVLNSNPSNGGFGMLWVAGNCVLRRAPCAGIFTPGGHHPPYERAGGRLDGGGCGSLAADVEAIHEKAFTYFCAIACLSKSAAACGFTPPCVAMSAVSCPFGRLTRGDSPERIPRSSGATGLETSIGHKVDCRLRDVSGTNRRLFPSEAGVGVGRPSASVAKILGEAAGGRRSFR